MPNFKFEDGISGVVAGIDEVGRGPWAGPVVAAAVILDRNNFPQGMDDSKKLSAKKRERIFLELKDCAQIGLGLANVEEIDDLNILAASMLAMQRAIANLPALPDHALIDGNKSPELPCCPTTTIIKGDSISLSIAAASIYAKVTRDKMMAELAEKHPFYSWEKNAGYGTKAHQQGLAVNGVTIHHRKSFKPIAKLLTTA